MKTLTRRLFVKGGLLWGALALPCLGVFGCKKDDSSSSNPGDPNHGGDPSSGDPNAGDPNPGDPSGGDSGYGYGDCTCHCLEPAPQYGYGYGYGYCICPGYGAMYGWGPFC